MLYWWYLEPRRSWEVVVNNTGTARIRDHAAPILNPCTLSTRYLLGIYLTFSWETFYPKIIKNYRKLDKIILYVSLGNICLSSAYHPLQKVKRLRVKSMRFAMCKSHLSLLLRLASCSGWHIPKKGLRQKTHHNSTISHAKKCSVVLRLIDESIILEIIWRKIWRYEIFVVPLSPNGDEPNETKQLSKNINY